MPAMDDPVSQMLVNEMCECTDKAEENRIKMSQAGKRGMKKGMTLTMLKQSCKVLITPL